VGICHGYCRRKGIAPVERPLTAGELLDIIARQPELYITR
jgi:hypothetical protein